MKRSYIVIYKIKNEKKDRFRVFKDFENAYMFYQMKKDYVIKIYISLYERLV